MNQTQVDKAFDVIGISLRTTNQAAITDGTIGRLWEQFFVNNVLAQIPNKIDNAIIAVYYDFEHDKQSEYTLLIGARVSSLDNVPTGLTALHVPAQKRTVFISEKGFRSSVVVDLWKKIWALEDEGKLDHSYTTDYEVYDERSQDPQNAQVEIHIGTK